MKKGRWVREVIVPAITALAVATTACVGGIDESLISAVSNNDAYATIDHLWGGARSAILREREPSTNAFNLPLSFALPCTRGGSGTYQGTLAGTKSAGTGNATLSLSGVLSACQFDDITTIRAVSAPSVSVTGSVAITADTWGAVNIRLVATALTINGVACPGGIDVVITGTSPSAQATSTGTACGRTGAVALP